MKNIVLIIALSALMVASVGCKRAETPASPALGREVTVSLPALSVEPAPQTKAPALEVVEKRHFGKSGVMTIARTEVDGLESPDTKAGTHEAFTNVWVLQFASDGTKLQCRNVGAVAADQPITATLTVAAGSAIYVLANGPVDGLDAVVTNLTTFLAATEAVPANGVVSLWGKLENVDVVTVGGQAKIIMPGGNPLLILLKPNAARVNLTLDVTKAVGSTLKSVALRSVPDKGNCVSGTTMPAGVGYATWGSRTTAPFSWNMPQNRQGVVGSITDDAGRTHANSPANATYARVTLGAATSDYRFDVFLGGGVTDFNVINNRTYNVKVTIAGTEADFLDMSASDDRVTTPSLDYTTTPANCYVGYPEKGVYLPIQFNALKKPIAKFAKGNATPVNIKGTNPSTVDALLENDIVYTALDVIEVSWQTAVNHGTVGGAANMVIKSAALGADGIATVEVNGPGNAVLSYKRGGVILWNYHIWVTDSNPFVTHPVSTTGGDVNGKVEGGTQAGFMDRNLGALAATATKPAAADAYKYFGVIYQHGRSTPFSGQGVGTTVNTYTVIYNGAATKLSSGSIGGYTQSNTAVSSVTDAIKTPNTYYYEVVTNWTWYKFGDISLWSDYGTNKSIYDPCPYGYRIPINGSWNGFPATSWTANTIDGGAVWSSTWWPAAGWRTDGGGAIGDVGGYAYYWSSSRHSNAYRSYTLYFDCYGYVYPSNNSTRSNGFTVRCVQEGY